MTTDMTTRHVEESGDEEDQKQDGDNKENKDVNIMVSIDETGKKQIRHENQLRVLFAALKQVILLTLICFRNYLR